MLAILRYDRYRRNCVAKLKNEGAGKFRKARKDRRGGREFQAAVKLGEAADYSASGRTSASHPPDNGGNLDRKELNHHLSRTIYDDCAGRHCANVKRFSVKITCSMVMSSFVCSIATDIAQQPNVRFYMMGARRKRVLMAETAIQFLERWRLFRHPCAQRREIHRGSGPRALAAFRLRRGRDYSRFKRHEHLRGSFSAHRAHSRNQLRGDLRARGTARNRSQRNRPSSV